MDDRERRELRNSAGDAFSSAFEMVVTPALFGLLGWFLDTRVGIFPVFTLVLVGITLAYEVWKLARRYNEEMDAALEERRAAYGQRATS